jgi:hypothetical protein
MQLWHQVARAVPPSTARFGGPVRVAAAVLAAAVVVAGIWVTGAVLTDDATAAMTATAGWIVLVSLLAVLAGLRWRPLALPVVGAVLLTSAGLGGALLWTSRVDRVVVEDVLTAGTGSPPAPAATSSAPAPSAPAPAGRVRPPRPAGPALLGSGAFRSGEHRTTGVAALLRRPSGTAVVTLTDLDTSPGPDLRVYLAVDPAGAVAGGVDLGRLRGNRGTQQYEVPAGVDLRRYGAVVIWCRAFTVAFGTATLTTPG